MSAIELDANTPMFNFTILEDGNPTEVVITAADFSRWTSGDFKPEDAKAVGVLIQFTLNQEAQSAQQTAFYIALMSFVNTLIEKGQGATAIIVMKAIAGNEIDRNAPLLEARLGHEWMEKAGQAVTMVAQNILTPGDPSKEN